MSELTAVSLFSGCGGFDLGATRAGIEIVWANDIDPCAAFAYKSLLPSVEFKENDVRTIREFPQADILIGCYPCTGFSLGARRCWHDQAGRDLRDCDGNFLYREFLRALRQVQPKYLIVENVRGMSSAADGWFLDAQLRGFKRHGYRTKWKLLDASQFGVPQTRKRVFIVGVRDDSGALQYEFPLPTYGPGMKRPVVSQREAIAGMKQWPEGEFFDFRFHGHYLTRNRKRRWSEPSYTVVANPHHVPLHPMGRPMKYIGEDAWELQGKSNRRLSWRECAVLQGLPTDIELVGSLHDKYRVVGNAVPPALAAILFRPIVTFESQLA